MKPNLFHRGAFFIFVLLSSAAFCQGQGALTPPGTPAPTMKSLDQIEPRIPVQSLPGSASSMYVISQPGSYYLTGNIYATNAQNGIEIGSANATLDLNGYTLYGQNVGLNAIYEAGNVIFSIHDGTIMNWTGKGVEAASSSLCSLKGLALYYCGGGGIELSVACRLTDCTLFHCGSTNNNGAGISVGGECRLINCNVSSDPGPGDGIGVDYATTVDHCNSSENGGSGIVGHGASVRVESCSTLFNVVDGIRMMGVYSEVLNCTAHANGNNAGASTNAGIHMTASHSRVDGSSSSDNSGRGIVVDFANGQTVVTRCSATDNATSNYSIATGNRAATIVSYSTSTGYTSGDPLVNTQ